MDNQISSFFTLISTNIMYPIYYGLVGVIALGALIRLLIEFVKSVTDPKYVTSNRTVMMCIGVLLGMFFMAFAPFLINWLVSISGNTHMTPVS